MKSIVSRLTMILTLRCDEASRLMSDSFDRKLRVHEWLALRGHLLVCSVCPKLHDQIRTVVRACRQPREVYEISHSGESTTPDRPSPQLSDEAKRRIKNRLRAADDSPRSIQEDTP